MRAFSLRLVSLLALLLVSSNAYAISVASELISDPAPFELFNRDLTRTRTDSTGTVVETNDATIIAENLVSASFGVTNTTDVTYQHNLTWISPPAGTFLSADLEILAFGNLGGDDKVFSDNINLGSLTPGSLGTLFFSTTVFSGINPITLNGILADGLLSITIDKNSGAGFPANLNLFSVYSSKLTVTYDAVPEPSTWALLGLGLAGIAAVRKRRAA